MADSSHILLVEGSDDKNVVERLWNHHTNDSLLPFKIEVEVGIDSVKKSLKEYLKVAVKVGNPERIGVVVDADFDLASRWQSLRDILLSSGYEKRKVPIRPKPQGTIIRQTDLPVVGFWLMPDNQLHGMLEDFVSLLVPPGDLLWNKAVHCVEEAAAIDLRFPQEHTIKARIYTWLAWQKEPGKPFGIAIKAKNLDADASNAKLLMDWINQLFLS